MSLNFRKVGRLKPKDDGLIHIIRDEFGEIGTMTIEDVENILAGMEPQGITPDGYSELSVAGKGYKMIIPANDGQLYIAITDYVCNMLEK